MTIWMLITSTAFAAVSALPPTTDPGSAADPAAAAAETRPATVSGETAMGLLRRWKQETDYLRQGLAEQSAAISMERLQVLRAINLSPADDGDDLTPHATSLYRSIQNELESLRALFEQIEAWEENLRINQLRGHAGHVMMRAEAFSVERKYRRELQDRVGRTTELLEQWALVHEFLLADQSRRLSRMMVLLTLEDAERSSQTPGKKPAAELETYEYYEVQTAATLREISALPEVYGDPEQWTALYQANRDQIPNPAHVVAQGTVLVVPHQKTTRAFEF